MPITYEHRVPAATLGGLALAAGQEQYEAERGREDRARAVQLAQMRQQQQMQNQRMAYDAASTQYRTMADYNRFVAGAQMDAQQRGQDQQNRVALMNQQNELAAGREQVRWDNAQEVAGQQDTLGAWKSLVDEIRPTLSPAGLDILDNHSSKFRSIMANQKFGPGPKAAAVSQLIEEVQAKNLGQDYAKEQMYEPGKSYNTPHGYRITVRGNGDIDILGQNFDDLEKPMEMSEGEWEKNGKHMAWVEAHQWGPVGRNKDGMAEYQVVGPDGKSMVKISMQDDIYASNIERLKREELDKDEKLASAELKKNRATAYSTEMDDIAGYLGDISSMTIPTTKTNADGTTKEVDRPATSQEKRKEYERRKDMAMKAVNELYPEPGAALEERLKADVGQNRPTLGDMLEGGEDWSKTKLEQREDAARKVVGAGVKARVPADTEEAQIEEEGEKYESEEAQDAVKAAAMVSEPEIRSLYLELAELLEAISLEPDGMPTEEQERRHDRMQQVIDRYDADPEGYVKQRRGAGGAALISGQGEGGTGNIAAARKMKAVGIMAGTPEGDFVLENIRNVDWAINVVLENRKSSFVDIEDPTTGSYTDRGPASSRWPESGVTYPAFGVVREEAGLFPREERIP